MDLITVLDQESIDLFAKLERSIDSTKNKNNKMELIKVREVIHLLFFERKNSKFAARLNGLLMFILTIAVFTPTLATALYFMNYFGILVFILNASIFFYFKFDTVLKNEVYDLENLRLNTFIKKLFKELLK